MDLRVGLKESWVPKNWCFWAAVLEKTLESHLDCKEIQPVHPKGNQSWMFIGRTVAGAETPILWPPDVKSWLTGKDPDAGKDWRPKEKGAAEDEIASLTQWTWGWANARRSAGQQTWHAAVHGAAKSQTRLSSWTTTRWVGRAKDKRKHRGTLSLINLLRLLITKLVEQKISLVIFVRTNVSL